MPRSTVARAFGVAALGPAAGLAMAPASAQGLLTGHRVSSVVAGELVAGAVAACKERGYNVTATLVDIDGVRQAMLRGDGAGIATLDVSNADHPQGTAHAVAQGAIVIKIVEEFVAALGISSAPGGEKDEACARAALDKVSVQLK